MGKMDLAALYLRMSSSFGQELATGLKWAHMNKETRSTGVCWLMDCWGAAPKLAGAKYPATDATWGVLECYDGISMRARVWRSNCTLWALYGIW
jgi:hypothetical protein